MDKDDDINSLFIESQQLKREHTRKGATPKAKKIKVRGSVEVARDNYKASKRMHRAAIKALRAAIKTHKLQIKQAKMSYKLVKLADKK